jgi:hypothetical protein
VELFRCGKKGHGLQAKERIPRGSFVIEYVGEVCPFSSRARVVAVFSLHYVLQDACRGNVKVFADKCS